MFVLRAFNALCASEGPFATNVRSELRSIDMNDASSSSYHNVSKWRLKKSHSTSMRSITSRYDSTSLKSPFVTSTLLTSQQALSFGVQSVELVQIVDLNVPVHDSRQIAELEVCRVPPIQFERDRNEREIDESYENAIDDVCTEQHLLRFVRWRFDKNVADSNAKIYNIILNRDVDHNIILNRDVH